MSQDRKTHRSPSAARFVALLAALLVGINLRPAITSVAALLQETSSAFELSGFWSSALATLPVIAFGITAPLGPLLSRHFGVSHALSITMLVLGATLVARVMVPGALLPGTFIAGVAIMAAGTLLPSYLKSFAATGVWIGLSSMSFGVGAALGASLAIPIYRAAGNSVAWSLGIWAALAVIATVVMFAVGRNQPACSRANRARTRLAPSDALTVALVTGVFGLQALLYFAVTAYLPQLLALRGLDAATAGWLLAWFSIIGLIPTLLMPIVAQRRRLLLIVAPALGLITSAGMVWLALAAGPYPLIIAILGAVQSAAFGLALALIVQLSADHDSAGTMSAISQGAGYAVAGIGSLLIGVIYTVTQSWPIAFITLAAIAFLLAVITAAAIRRQPVALFEQPAR